jgi:hypothetical protein
MKYTILVYETPEDFAKRNGPDPSYWGAHAAYNQAMQQAGVAAGGAGLMPPSTGTSIRTASGKRHVQDGPFADTKEQLGGYYVIDVANLDQAIEWAARCPSASTGGVEVRPHIQMPPQA